MYWTGMSGNSCFNNSLLWVKPLLAWGGVCMCLQPLSLALAPIMWFKSEWGRCVREKEGGRGREGAVLTQNPYTYRKPFGAQPHNLFRPRRLLLPQLLVAFVSDWS